MPIFEAAAAALNNAEWCAAVWRSHGLAVQKKHGLWRCAGPPPPYYPNVVTVDPTADIARQFAFIGEIKRDERGVAFSVKDSFSCLDLHALDMSILFTAQWLVRAPNSKARPTTKLAWSAIVEQRGLAEWERAWRGGAASGTPIFLSALLSDRNTMVLGGRNDDGALVAGAIAFEAAGLLGVTNIFGDRQEFFAALARARPEASLVCYETGRDLSCALLDGFEVLGRLRVWSSA